VTRVRKKLEGLCLPPRGLCDQAEPWGERAGAWGAARWCRRNEAERDGKKGRPMGTEARKRSRDAPLPKIQD
jgi:hypothetical protein